MPSTIASSNARPKLKLIPSVNQFPAHLTYEFYISTPPPTLPPPSKRLRGSLARSRRSDSLACARASSSWTATKGLNLGVEASETAERPGQTSSEADTKLLDERRKQSSSWSCKRLMLNDATSFMCPNLRIGGLGYGLKCLYSCKI